MGKHSARAPRAVSRPATPAASGAGSGPGAAGHDATAAPQGESEGEPLVDPFGPVTAPEPGSDGFPGQRQEVGVGWGVIGVQRVHGADAGAYGPGSVPGGVPGGDARLAGYLGGYGAGQEAGTAYDTEHETAVGAPYETVGGSYDTVGAPYDTAGGTYDTHDARYGAPDAPYDTYDTTDTYDTKRPGQQETCGDPQRSPYWLGGAPVTSPEASAAAASYAASVFPPPAPPSQRGPASGPASGPAADGSAAAPGRVPAPRPGSARPRPGGSRGAPRDTASPKSGGGMARTATGVAAAVVTAVLAVVVAGQVEDGADPQAQARAADVERSRPDEASRSDSRPTPNGGAAEQLTYDQKMARKYPLDEKAKGSGSFETVGGHDAAPGRGDVLRYRVDVEKGLPLDGDLFATAVHRTLNDERSWGHGGTRTFERVSSGHADFVVTLASPGTTAVWCAKSGLDTTEDNVSCDSAATDRVMINGYRWAQGARTYGDNMLEYRQMLINHEVGHRLGHDHETCGKEGALAPVMMQQTKFLTTDGLTCRPNPWPYP
ncbi:DUF3152 domain-containing protein [Streptomyces sp. NPDC008001]|uniref:DUF3152 domain-containing protein n=1 Tax=Streptomyces sp. NPDC008001 TaxID=3364804 RepID=UPI0036E5DA7E